ncbi:hypothetical protein BH11BAC2_BH11BAC2_19450 [soil metagenome]
MNEDFRDFKIHSNITVQIEHLSRTNAQIYIIMKKVMLVLAFAGLGLLQANAQEAAKAAPVKQTTKATPAKTMEKTAPAKTTLQPTSTTASKGTMTHSSTAKSSHHHIVKTAATSTKEAAKPAPKPAATK